MATRSRGALVLMTTLAWACGTDAPAGDFDGDYEVTERVRADGCEGPLTEIPVEAPERYFRLRAEPVDDGGTRIAYYACVSPGECNDVLDLFRSFGRSDGAWVTTVATAIAPGCLLRFRRRELMSTEEGVLIVERVYEETDETLDDASCVQDVARERGDSMPCVEVVETTARRLP